MDPLLVHSRSILLFKTLRFCFLFSILQTIMGENNVDLQYIFNSTEISNPDMGLGTIFPTGIFNDI